MSKNKCASKSYVIRTLFHCKLYKTKATTNSSALFVQRRAALFSTEKNKLKLKWRSIKYKWLSNIFVLWRCVCVRGSVQYFYHSKWWHIFCHKEYSCPSIRIHNQHTSNNNTKWQFLHFFLSTYSTRPNKSESHHATYFTNRDEDETKKKKHRTKYEELF